MSNRWGWMTKEMVAEAWERTTRTCSQSADVGRCARCITREACQFRKDQPPR